MIQMDRDVGDPPQRRLFSIALWCRSEVPTAGRTYEARANVVPLGRCRIVVGEVHENAGSRPGLPSEISRPARRFTQAGSHSSRQRFNVASPTTPGLAPAGKSAQRPLRMLLAADSSRCSFGTAEGWSGAQRQGRIWREISSAHASMSGHWRLSPAWPPRALNSSRPHAGQ